MPEYIEEAITDYWGPRCDTRDELCHPCHAWKEYDLLCRERADIVALLRKGGEWESRIVGSNIWNAAADAIERGDHA